MSTILEVEEMVEARSGKISLDNVTREYKRTWKVLTSDAGAEQLQVMLAYLSPTKRIPRWGEPYISNSWADYGALVVDIDATNPEKDLPTFWLVTATYRSRSGNPAAQQGADGGPGGGGGGGGSGESPQLTHPIFQRPQVTWGTKKILRPILKDVDGKVIATTAGTPYDVQTEEVPLRTMTLVRNELQFLPFSSRIYIGRVNADTFQRTRPGYVLCEDIRHQTAFSDGIDYAIVTYEFTFEDDEDPDNSWPWYLSLIDKGPKYVENPGSGSARVVRYKDATGLGGDEVFLNGLNGGVHENFNLDTGQLATGATAKINRFRRRKSIIFGDLKLPDPAWF